MMMKIVKPRNKLYEFLKEEYLGDNYSIGFHGVAKYRLTGNSSCPSIPRVLENIFRDGLNINAGRGLLGTTQFYDENLLDSFDKKVFKDEEDFVSRYQYGEAKDYVIVALPKSIKNSQGEELYLGYPVYGKTEDTKGYELTTLVDLLLPEYGEEQSKLPTEFILGKLDIDGTASFSPNPNHMSMNGNIVSDELFDRCKKRIELANKFYGIEESFRVDSNKDCELNTEILEEEYERIISLADKDKMKIEEELQKYDYQTRIFITSYPAAVRNTLEEYKKEKGINR